MLSVCLKYVWTMNLKDKVIIVTGGRGLIGREIVRELNDHGARVVDADISCETDAD
ncbi:NAD-dependent epimerase/dehydratase family protein, partial [uncultured Duncaniella sp.]|uniref:NAD-dependent epimerase/dehydratase family protein n=1 Tax=uncultured Duncaniella sp. TaxID=2768039 RepID=UPI00349F3FD0